ncbi:MAG: hypothetical protein JNJ43_01300, partial [Anaerolineales bacterium]|nr:hypothetical protein [Anaerolineales bacterium]
IADKKITKLFSKDLQLINLWNLDTSEIIWRPDSLGAFLLTNEKIFYSSIRDREPILIEDCVPNYCSINDYIWLP